MSGSVDAVEVDSGDHGYNWLFRAFRFGSPSVGWGPTYYGGRNDIPAAYDQETILIALAAATVYLLFVLSVITARRRRLPTFLVGSIVVAAGVAIAVGLLQPKWAIGRADMVTSYCVFNPGMYIKGSVQLDIGLDHYNVSYYNSHIAPSDRGDEHNFEFYYNDRFEMVFGGKFLKKPKNKMRAIELGLPNPVIVVAEYMDTVGGGFQWGSAIPAAGYYAGVTLQFAAVCYAVTLILLVLIPSYGMYTLAATGAVMVSSCLVYYLSFPGSGLSTIVVEGNPLRFEFGVAFVLVLTSGVANIFAAATVLIISALRNVKSVSTFFELDFDTPFDNKVLKADSEQRRKQSTTAIPQPPPSFMRASVRRFRESLRFSNGRRIKSANFVDAAAAIASATIEVGPAGANGGEKKKPPPGRRFHSAYDGEANLGYVEDDADAEAVDGESEVFTNNEALSEDCQNNDEGGGRGDGGGTFVGGGAGGDSPLAKLGGASSGKHFDNPSSILLHAT